MVMRAIQICTNEIVQGMNMVTVMLVCIISVKWHNQTKGMQSMCPWGSTVHSDSILF